ncbi:MAG: rRNA pseudouridine synthase [Candidatus Eisenbacteria sp.]|nr:rRNA pseudouridine synthase [Candidatus Eisenbacteria bacterium]
MRLNRYLAFCGVASRRGAMTVVLAGRVQVNGHIILDPGQEVICGADRVKVDGEDVRAPGCWVYHAFYKPRGVVVSARDELGREGLQPYLRRMREHVFPVGRLDRNSEGLLLLTNHGKLGHALLHPSCEIEKLYLVTVAPRPRPWQLARVAGGVPIGQGEYSGPVQVRVKRADRKGAVLRLTLTEGKKREIRRICQAVGLRVLRLRRVSFAGVRLQGLEPGKHRPLNPEEVAGLKALTGLEL